MWPLCKERSKFLGIEAEGGWGQHTRGCRKETREAGAPWSIINYQGYSCPASGRLHGGAPSNGDLLYSILLHSLIGFSQLQAHTSFLIAILHMTSDAVVTNWCSGEAAGCPHTSKHLFLNPVHGIAWVSWSCFKAEVRKLQPCWLNLAHHLVL